MDRDDRNHRTASETFSRALKDEALVTHNYVVLETLALAQRRLGVASVRTLVDDMLPSITVLWIDGALHQEATTALLALGRRSLSLVDTVSFQLMRRRGISSAFCFDLDFAEQGFRVLPGSETTRSA